MADEQPIAWSPKMLVGPAIVLVAAVAWWLLMSGIIQGRADLFTAHWVAVVSKGILLFAIFGVWAGTILVSCVGVPWWWRAVVGFVGTLPVVIFFTISGLNWLAMVAIWAGVWTAIEQGSGDARQNIRWQPRVMIARAVGPMILGVMFGVSLLYFQQVRGTASSQEEVASRMINSSVVTVEKLIPRFYPSYRSDQPIDEFIGAQFPTADDILSKVKIENGMVSADDIRGALKEKYGALIPGIDSLELPAQVSVEQLRRDMDQQFNTGRTESIVTSRTEIAKRFDLTLTGKETMHDVLTMVINKQFDQKARQYVTFLPALLALVLFFVLRILSPLFHWSAVLMGWGMAALLRLLKVFRLEAVTIAVQKMRWE